MPAGDRQPLELLADDEAWRHEPVRVAEALGHVVEWDPGTQDRWTCVLCCRAVLRAGTNIYGSAATEPCM
jgi:hypothetical protein